MRVTRIPVTPRTGRNSSARVYRVRLPPFRCFAILFPYTGRRLWWFFYYYNYYFTRRPFNISIRGFIVFFFFLSRLRLPGFTELRRRLFFFFFCPSPYGATRRNTCLAARRRPHADFSYSDV